MADAAVLSQHNGGGVQKTLPPVMPQRHTTSLGAAGSSACNSVHHWRSDTHWQAHRLPQSTATGSLPLPTHAREHDVPLNASSDHCATLSPRGPSRNGFGIRHDVSP